MAAGVDFATLIAAQGRDPVATYRLRPEMDGGIARDRPSMIVPAHRLGPQLHLGAVDISAARWRPVAMRTSVLGGVRHRNSPFGGLWTARLEPGPSSAHTRMACLVGWHRRSWWRLDPDREAVALVIDRAADYAATMRHYPYREGRHLDFPAIARDGFAAVHVTNSGASLPELHAWQYASTLWLRWAFAGEPVSLDPPKGYYRAPPPLPPDAPAPVSGATRSVIGGVTPAAWVDVSPALSADASAMLAWIQREHAAAVEGAPLDPFFAAMLAEVAALYDPCPGTTRSEAFLSDCAIIVLVDDRVVAHNFRDTNGLPCPVGYGFGAHLLVCDRLLLLAVGQALMRSPSMARKDDA